MPNYRRFQLGRVWFFTVVTHRRRRFLTDDPARECLREAVKRCRARFPFEIDGWVLMPDHIHAVWTLPESDLDYSRRWSLVKRLFTQGYREVDRRGPPYWQPRFWAHCVTDERDFQNHIDYIHFNPVKHGRTERVADWPWSSFHRLVRNGVYAPDWGDGVSFEETVGNE